MAHGSVYSIFKMSILPLGVNDAPLSYIKRFHLIDKRFIKNSKFFTKSKIIMLVVENMMLKDDVFLSCVLMNNQTS